MDAVEYRPDPISGLTLCEAFLLLALYYPERGELADVSVLNMELNGVALVELALAERIAWDGQGAQVVDSRPLGDPLLDRVLQRAEEAGYLRGGDSGWSVPFTNRLTTGQHTLNRLYERGVLRVETKKGMLGSKQVVVDDGRTRPALMERLLRSMVAPGHVPPFEATLVFLWHLTAGGMIIKDRRQRQAYEKRCEAMFGDYWGHVGQDRGEAVPGLSPTARRTIGELVAALGINIAEGIGYEVDKDKQLGPVADTLLEIIEGFLRTDP